MFGFSNFRKEDEVLNAEIYAHDILGDLNHGSNGYVDWNILLDNNGGPNHKLNYCNAPIMLTKNNECYKNLSYYYISHFSKYIEEDSINIQSTSYTDKIEICSFKNKDSIVVILLNRDNQNHEYNLCINNTLIHDNLDSHAIVTYKIKK